MSLSPKLQRSNSDLVATFRCLTPRMRLPKDNADPSGTLTTYSVLLTHSTNLCHSFCLTLKFVALGECRSRYNARNHGRARGKSLKSHCSTPHTLLKVTRSVCFRLRASDKSRCKRSSLSCGIQTQPLAKSSCHPIHVMETPNCSFFQLRGIPKMEQKAA